MAERVGRAGEVGDLRTELEHLTSYINAYMWDERSRFYGDRLRDGSVNPVKTIGAYWTLLAGLVPDERLAGFVGHLEERAEFNRPHRVPSLAADHPDHQVDGG
jgi:hypothetical protein